MYLMYRQANPCNENVRKKKRRGGLNRGGLKNDAGGYWRGYAQKP